MSLTTNLVSYWKLDESSGNAADSVGANTLTNTSVTYGAAKINNGAIFDGSASKFVGGTTQDALPLTIAFWMNIHVKPANSGAQRFAAILGNQTTGAEGWFCDLFFDDLAFRYGIGGGSAFEYAYSNFTLDTWYHIAITITSTHAILYVNGSQVNDGTPLGGTYTASSASIWAGNFPTLTRFYNGKLDEIGIWSRALTSGEVTQLYNGGAGLAYPFSSPNGNFLAFM